MPKTPGVPILRGYMDAGADVPAACVVGTEAIRSAIDAGHPVWVDVESPTDEDLEQARQLFSFHPLALEDVHHDIQRPKLEEYPGHLFIVAFGVSGRGVHWSPQEVDIFIGKNYIVTFHEESVGAVARIADWCERGKISFEQGADRILYTILDGLVDECFPLLEGFDEHIEGIEHKLLDGPSGSLLEEIFLVRKELLRLRKLLPGHRELLGHLSMYENPGISPAVRTYLRDVYDHVLRIGDTADTYRELLDTAVDTYMSRMAERTNQVMKLLAIIATMGLPFTVMTGFYGMNFDHIPGLRNPAGVWILLGGLIVTEGILVGVFRRKGWL
jgi:magnesium transporter